MEVTVRAGERMYIVDTVSREIIRTNGGGRPPSDERKAQIIAEAVKAAMARQTITGISVTPTNTPRPTSTPKLVMTPTNVVPQLTDAELLEKMQERATMMREIMEGATFGEFPAVVCAGGPGMGKSHTAEEILRAASQDPQRNTRYKIVQGGRMTPVELYDMLYKYRQKGNVLVLDDSDTILAEEQGIMLFKAALDSKPIRTLSWRSQGAKTAPEEYEFSGSVIFLTNQDFSAQIDKGGLVNMNKRQQHLAAIRSRCTYLDLMMSTPRARWLWTYNQITKQRILEKQGLRAHEQTEVLSFIRENVDNLMEVSIRSAVNMIPFVLMNRRDPSKDWRKRVAIVQFRQNIG